MKIKGKKRETDVIRIKKIHFFIFIIALISFVSGILVNYFVTKEPGESKVITTSTTSTLQKIQKDLVEVGDEVEINYIAKLKDGSIYDASYEEVGREAGLNKTMYRPLRFRVGSGQVIQGLDEAVRGMKIGEEKTVMIPPEKGFGFRDEAKILEIPRIQEKARIYNLSLGEFQGLVGRGVKPILNKTYQPRMMQWPITVLNFTEGRVTIRDEPEVNMTLETMYEEARVISVNETEIRVRVTTSPGAKLNTMRGRVTVLEVNETMIKIDTNPELAGKTLIFQIKVEDLTKG